MNPEHSSKVKPQETAPQRVGIRTALRGFRKFFFLLLGLGLFMIALSIALSWGKIIEELNRPLGPTLPPVITHKPTAIVVAQNAIMPTLEPQTSSVISPAIPPIINLTPTISLTPTANLSPTPAPEPLCGGPEQMTILAVGSDTGDGYIRGLADVIRVVRVDFVTPSVSMITIHRDTWVSIPGLGEYGDRLEAYFGHLLDPNGNIIEQPGDWARVNVAYFYGNLYSLPGNGTGTLARTLYQNYGLQVDHYIVTDMNVFVRAIDAVGGIDMYVPYAVGGFDAGQQHMSGEQTLRYARTRREDNDFYRTSRQDILLMAIQEKLLRPQQFLKIPELIDVFLDEVMTDLSKAQLLSLACIASKLESDDITIYNPPALTPAYTTRGSYILLLNEEDVRAKVTDFMNGTQPDSQP